MVIKESCQKKLACKAQQLLPEHSSHHLHCCGNPEEEEDDDKSTLNLSEDRNLRGHDFESGQKHKKDRGNWAGKLDFFLSCVGYAVGLGNIWRFPYLCYRNGGGAFLIPYFLFLILCGMPLFMLEISFGQFANLGPISIWKISPLFKGLGYGMVIISGIVCIYYNIIITWTLYYMFLCFRRVVPWATCGNWWNSEHCVGVENEDQVSSVVEALANSTSSFLDVENATDFIANSTNATVTEFQGGRVTASEEFWLNHVLQLSSGLEEMGSLRWELLATLLVAWILVFCCLFKGVKSSGKVVYFSATFPYAVLVILLVYGVTRPGAGEGILFYLTPRWELLSSFEVWGDAATQIFYSVGPAWGGLLTMASYNKFNHNCYRDAFIIPLINCGTSVFAGFVVFSVIGFMAHVTGRPISEVVSQGPGLAFVVYPEAVTHLPAPPVWAFLFFSMLFTIGLDSQFGMFECLISALSDEFPVLRNHKRMFTVAMCGLLFILGIPCVMQGGMYILQLMDWYCAAFSLMIISFFECIVIGWIYGADRFMEDIKLMTGKTPSKWWKWCWQFITPTIILLLLLFTLINHKPVTYGSYIYPRWSLILGWMMALCSLIPIPVMAVAQLRRARNSANNNNKSCGANGGQQSLGKCILDSLRPASGWGPSQPEFQALYRESLGRVPAGKMLDWFKKWGGVNEMTISRKDREVSGEVVIPLNGTNTASI